MKTFTPPNDNPTADELFDSFIGQFSHHDLYDAAEEFMKEIRDAHPCLFENTAGGLMGRVIQNVVGTHNYAPFGPDFIGRTMEHYGFDNKTVPPRLLLRELMRLEIHRNKLLTCLIGDTPAHEIVLEFVERTLTEFVCDLSEPSKVALIPDADLDEVVAQMEVLKSGD